VFSKQECVATEAEGSGVEGVDQDGTQTDEIVAFFELVCAPYFVFYDL